MKHWNHLKLPTLLLSLALSPCVLCLEAATVSPFGTALAADITSAFVPPTRSDNPYVTTGQKLYQWDDSGQWIPLYSPPWATSRILEVAGYEKSSKVLYIVHSSGIARSGDGGETWIEAVPPAFDGQQGRYSLQINPDERRHAVLASGNRLWETTDYGESWFPVDLAADLGQVVGHAFIGTSEGLPRLLVARQNGLQLYEGEPLKPAGEWQSGHPLVGAVAHPDKSTLFLQDHDGNWMALTITDDGSSRIHSMGSTGKPSFAAANASGTTSLWMVSGDELRLVSLSNERTDPFRVAGFQEGPSRLLVHPRMRDALYVAAKNQLFLVEDAFNGASAAFIEPLDVSRGEIVQWGNPPQSKTGMPGKQPLPAEEQPMDVAVLLSKVLAGEPSFRETFSKVLHHEQTKPGAFAEWQKKARSRHLIPELRIYGGVREYGIDDNLLVTSTNQFGIEEIEDYRLPDRIRSMGYLGIALEWPLAELVYDEELVDISRERRYYFRDRRRLVEDLAEIFYGRINRIIEMEGFMGKPTRTQELKLLLEINQLSEILNGYCGEDLFDPMPLD